MASSTSSGTAYCSSQRLFLSRVVHCNAAICYVTHAGDRINDGDEKARAALEDAGHQMVFRRGEVLLVGARGLGAVEPRVAPRRPRQRYHPLPGPESVGSRSILFDHAQPCKPKEAQEPLSAHALQTQVQLWDG